MSRNADLTPAEAAQQERNIDLWPTGPFCPKCGAEVGHQRDDGRWVWGADLKCNALLARPAAPGSRCDWTTEAAQQFSVKCSRRTFRVQYRGDDIPGLIYYSVLAAFAQRDRFNDGTDPFNPSREMRALKG